jgi:hypothetical protein
MYFHFWKYLHCFSDVYVLLPLVLNSHISQARAIKISNGDTVALFWCELKIDFNLNKLMSQVGFYLRQTQKFLVHFSEITEVSKK